MGSLTRSDVESLLDETGGIKISIYLPTHRKGKTEQDQIRYKNLIKEAEQELVGIGISAGAVDELVKKAQKLLSDEVFWQHQDDGLAVFLEHDTFHYYRLPLLLPELVVVAKRYHIKPVVPMLTSNNVFYVLALSQKDVRLLKCSQYNVTRVTPDIIPTSIAEFLQYDEPEKQLQLHTAESGRAIFHGHGITKDYDKIRILQYFKAIDQGLHKILKEEKAPLVVATVDYLHAIYQEASKYRYLIETGIEGNPDGLDDETLLQKAWSIVEPHFSEQKLEVLDRFQALTGTGLTTSSLEEAVLAAYDGRAEALFLCVGLQKWGNFNEHKRSILIHEERQPGDEDLFNLAAFYTIKKGGEVYAMNPDAVLPSIELAAIFRY
jgi:hypothetical protein